MTATQTLLLAASLTLPGADPSEPDRVELIEKVQAGDRARVSFGFTVKGVQRHLGNQNKGLELKFSATNRTIFEELVPGEAGSEAPTPRTLRYFTESAVESLVEDKRTVLQLREPVRLMVAELRGGRPFLFSPAGPLTPDEYDQVGGDTSLDTLTIGGLLPSEPVAVGESWKPANEAVAAVFNLTQVLENTLEAKLEKLNDESAEIRLAGKVEAMTAGTRTKLEITGRVLFDRKRSRISRVDISQKEDRAPGGPKGPGLVVDATLRVARDFEASLEHLDKSVAAQVPLEANPATEQLVYQHADGRFRFYFPRGWHIYYSDPRVVVLRLIENNDFVAQCNVTAGPTVAAGTHMKAEEFREQVKRALGQQFQKVIEEKEVPAPKGHWVYRVAAAGTAGDQPVAWYYYLAAGPRGQQLIFTFTLDARLAERFGPRDLAMVDSLEFEPARTASKPTSP